MSSDIVPAGVTAPYKPEESKPEETHPIVLFDGVCNLCDHAVNFIIDRDPTGHFRFASLQSPAGRAALARVGRESAADELDCLVLLEGPRVYECSTAALRVAWHLGGLWRLLWVLVVLPRFLRDGVYRWIAGNRYRWFGKADACRIPTPELRSRFLDDPRRAPTDAPEPV